MGVLGNIFKEAREKKGVTCSEAAAATRIKVQHIEAMENDDFSKFAAPAYAKGFIKLYAEYLELEPQPLIQEYVEHYMPGDGATLHEEDAPKKSTPKKRRPAKDWVRPAKAQLERLKKISSGFLGLVEGLRAQARWIGGVVLVLVVAVSISRCVTSHESSASLKPMIPADAQAVLQAPPEPYLQPDRY